MDLIGGHVRGSGSPQGKIVKRLAIGELPYTVIGGGFGLFSLEISIEDTVAGAQVVLKSRFSHRYQLLFLRILNI